MYCPRPALQPLPTVTPALTDPSTPLAAPGREWGIFCGKIPFRGFWARGDLGGGGHATLGRVAPAPHRHRGSPAARVADSGCSHPSALLSHPRLPDYFNEDNDSHLGNSNPLTITILISFHYKSETSSLTFQTPAIGNFIYSKAWVGWGELREGWARLRGAGGLGNPLVGSKPNPHSLRP